MLALKTAEFRAFIGGQSDPSSQVALTPSEAKLRDALLESAARLGRQQSAHSIRKKENASQFELDKLAEQITIAKKYLHDAFAEIPAHLKNTDQEAAATFKIEDNLFVRRLAALNAATPGAKNAIIAINPEAKHTTIALYSAKQPTHINLPIGMDQLNSLIESMRRGIQAKSGAWREPAQALHKLLIAPIEAQMQAQKLAPETLTLYLSGPLRAAPLAALLDSSGQFLVQKYRLSLESLQFSPDLTKTGQRDWDANAFGNTSGSAAEKQLKLPGAAKELAAIVRGPATPQGILPGDTYLDGNFIRKTWSQAFSGNPAAKLRSVLHVATHFKVERNWHQSKLLLGDSTTFSAQELAAEPGLSLSHVDLVTLSACETMVGDKEQAGFESLGRIFQDKGAGAVLGSLWPVADGGTAELMQKFYAARGEKRAMSKAAALRSAQLAFLSGEVKVANPLDGKPVDVRHPYYWAAFVLMGNWL